MMNGSVQPGAYGLTRNRGESLPYNIKGGGTKDTSPFPCRSLYCMSSRKFKIRNSTKYFKSKDERNKFDTAQSFMFFIPLIDVLLLWRLKAASYFEIKSDLYC
jgi:hypothetical protein